MTPPATPISTSLPPSSPAKPATNGANAIGPAR